MNLKWITPLSPFNLSYLRRLYLAGLLAVIVFDGSAVLTQADDWKVFVFAVLFVMSFLGWLTRVSMLALVILSLNLLKLPFFGGAFTVYYLHLGLILAVSRCADVLSVDGIFLSRSRADKGEIKAPYTSVVYSCPIRLFGMFCIASLVLARPSPPVVMFVFAGICLMSVMDWSKRFRRWGRRTFKKPMYVVYDGNCKLCRRTAAFLDSVDEIDRLIYVNGMNDAELKRYKLSHLDKTRLARDMHVVVGEKVFTGFYGYREMCKRIPVLWLTVPFLYLWPIPRIAQFFYRKIADSRGCAVVSRARHLQWVDPLIKPADLIVPAAVAALLLAGHLIYL